MIQGLNQIQHLLSFSFCQYLVIKMFCLLLFVYHYAVWHRNKWFQSNYNYFYWNQFLFFLLSFSNNFSHHDGSSAARIVTKRFNSWLFRAKYAYLNIIVILNLEIRYNQAKDMDGGEQLKGSSLSGITSQKVLKFATFYQFSPRTHKISKISQKRFYILIG